MTNLFKRPRKKSPSLAAREFKDGPLSFRPPEDIAYGTGKCALGPILVALSDKGIVTIMIRAKSAELIKELKTSPDGGIATDFFEKLNVLAIVVQVDKSLIAKAGPIVSSWTSTNKKP